MFMDIQIVHISIDNAELLNNIDPDAFDAPIDQGRITTYLANPCNIMFVAMNDDLVIGQARAMVHHHPDIATELYFDNLGVAEKYLRRGIGTRLVNAVIKAGMARGCEEIWLGTEPDNIAACGLYRAMKLTMEPMVMFHGLLDGGQQKP
ncbi:MAG: GNAT family N-acetyltransferase [Cohaesibacteraceae bacterium]|nr:GNAT family N-acetyltransferase [Cohaesibacteraceae bacterium]